jgi:ABC-type antimicrobial peptide transport system permease subunit
VAAGIVVGVGLSLWAGRAVRVLLHGLEPGDPATMLGAVGVLLVTAGLAGAIPAWQAARTDPSSALRQ